MQAGGVGCKRGRKGRDGVKGDKEAKGMGGARRECRRGRNQVIKTSIFLPYF